MVSKRSMFIILFSMFIWLSLYPYIIWSFKTSILALFFISSTLFSTLYFMNKKIGVNRILFVFILTILSFVYNIVDINLVGTLTATIVIAIIMLSSTTDILKIFNLFKILFAISLIPGIFILTLHILGFNIHIFEMGTMPPLNPLKLEGMYKPYLVIFPGSIESAYMLENTIFRLQAMYDEPGLLGTIAALILLTEKVNLQKKTNIIIFIGGLMSLSLAFYLLITFFYLFYIKKYFKIIMLLILSIGIIYMVLPNRIQNEIKIRTIDRLSLKDDGTIKGYNRDAKNSNNYEHWKESNVFHFLFGINANADGSSSWKNILIYHGYIGFILLITIYFLIFQLWAYKLNYDTLIFIFLFFLSFLQRPNIISPVYILIFSYAMIVLSRNNKIMEIK